MITAALMTLALTASPDPLGAVHHDVWAHTTYVSGFDHQFKPGPRGNCTTFAANYVVALKAHGIDGVIWSVLDMRHQPHAVVVVDDVWVLDEERGHVVTKASLEADGYVFEHPVILDDWATAFVARSERVK